MSHEMTPAIRKAAGFLSKAIAKKADSWAKYETHDEATIEAAGEIANLLVDMAMYNTDDCNEWMDAFTGRNGESK